jgi:hypothetical protein
MLKKAFQFGIVLFLIANVSYSQWNGTTTTGNTYREGNVGIGITNPSAKLEVANNGSGSFRVGVNSNMANMTTQLINSLAVLAEGKDLETTGLTLYSIQTIDYAHLVK